MTSLPTTNETAGALALPDVNEWGEVDNGWMGEAAPQAAPIVPQLVFNAKSDGGFIDEMTGEKYGENKTMRVLWLAWAEQRAYWKDPFGQGDKAPTCRSTNMLSPDDASTEKQATTCSACPLSRWNDNLPPACGVRVSVMLYLPEQQRVTRTQFGGLAMKHVQRFLGGFDTRVPYRPPMAFVTEITPTIETTANGNFLVPHFRLGDPITIDEARPLIELRDRLRKQWQQLAEDDLNQRDTATITASSDDIVYEDDEEPF